MRCWRRAETWGKCGWSVSATEGQREGSDACHGWSQVPWLVVSDVPGEVNNSVHVDQCVNDGPSEAVQCWQMGGKEVHIIDHVGHGLCIPHTNPRRSCSRFHGIVGREQTTCMHVVGIYM